MLSFFGGFFIGFIYSFYLFVMKPKAMKRVLGEGFYNE